MRNNPLTPGGRFFAFFPQKNPIPRQADINIRILITLFPNDQKLKLVTEWVI
jgi:hypothetical protein